MRTGSPPSGVQPPTGDAAAVAFACNAAMGEGGQGQFLQAMARAMDAWGNGRLFARAVSAQRAQCLSMPFQGGWRRSVLDLVLSLPIVRRRSDLLTLLSDEDFDGRLADSIGEVSLLDGIMGQCCWTFRTLEGTGTKRVLTSISTHIDHLDRTLKDEIRRVGAGIPTFVHPRMVQRAREEIAVADAIRVNSMGARQTFVDEGVPPDRVRSIPVCVNLDHFHPVTRTDDTFRVMVVGWIAPHKGTLYALQAFERARLPNAELVFVGGTGDPWSRRLMADFSARYRNIRMMAMNTSHEPVERHYGSASVVLHASIVDGFGLVIPEALASGRPVVVTRQTGASELVRDGENGFVVEARDVDAMADRLRLLHTDAALYDRVSRQARPSVAHLTVAAFSAEVHRLYREVLSLGWTEEARRKGILAAGGSS